MISRQLITELATKLQTIEENIAREYCQHLFLSYFYKKEEATKIAFKGGTALRILFKSPRFSEDLDFSAKEITVSRINQLIDSTVGDIRNEGVDCAKELNPGTQGETSGGYFAVIKFKMLDFDSEIKLQISFRDPEKVVINTMLVNNDFIAPYVATYLTESLLVSEKIEALLDRKKPRDFFDLYFILRNSELVKYVPRFPDLRARLLELQQKEEKLENELKVFLPVSYQQLLRDFKERLKKEIENHIG